jgi:hypothetical protein
MFGRIQTLPPPALILLAALFAVAVFAVTLVLTAHGHATGVLGLGAKPQHIYEGMSLRPAHIYEGIYGD